ncbi:MAG: 5-carboxymethyl-2-hydroxymuconate isomerase, partial [Actinobacteria bacterium]|nr:5-carboxymethyl-2-hydroxymuconate isomerase [Actinomycetota bacterium]
MRLVTFEVGGVARPGVVDGGEIVDLGASFESINAVIRGGAEAEALTTIEEVIAAGERVSLEGTKLAAPLVPENVFCVGWNYLKHFEEGAAQSDEELPEHPAFFSKSRTSVTGPFDDVPSHAGVTDKLDWEAELAVVIGTRGRDLTPENALEHVFGYTVGNDLSARDLQRRHGGQWIKGKSLDGTCPLGPWIVTRDEIADPQDVVVYSSVNGVEK